MTPIGGPAPLDLDHAQLAGTNCDPADMRYEPPLLALGAGSRPEGEADSQGRSAAVEVAVGTRM